jgi:hypothetical protein
MTATVGSAICAVSLCNVVRAFTRGWMPNVNAPTTTANVATPTIHFLDR